MRMRIWHAVLATKWLPRPIRWEIASFVARVGRTRPKGLADD